MTHEESLLFRRRLREIADRAIETHELAIGLLSNLMKANSSAGCTLCGETPDSPTWFRHDKCLEDLP